MTVPWISQTRIYGCVQALLKTNRAALCSVAPQCIMPGWFALQVFKYFCGKHTKACVYLQDTCLVRFTSHSWVWHLVMPVGRGVWWVQPHPPFGSDFFFLSFFSSLFLRACYRGWSLMYKDTPTPCLENWPNFFEMKKKVSVPPPPPPPPPPPRLISFFRTCKAGGGPIKRIAAYGPGAKSAPPFSKSFLRAWPCIQTGHGTGFAFRCPSR